MRSLERARTTNAVGRAAGIGLVLVCLLVPLSSMAQNQNPFPPVFNVPDIVNPNETPLQRETHFLTFIGSFVPQDASDGRAYYAAIDPGGTKADFPHWLKNAGFISDVGEWNPFGPQKFACNLPGCDYPAGTHGHGIINTDAHVIVLNAADLGFVRNQFIRCAPSCTAKNAIIYTYLENYPVAPFAKRGTNPSNFESQSLTLVSSAYPLQSEAANAINSAINRPLGVFPFDPVNNHSLDPNQAAFCVPGSDDCLERIADVAFEFNLSTGQGKLYAYQYLRDPSLVTVVPYGITETVDFAPHFVNNGQVTNQKTGLPVTIVAGDAFAPNLDFIGFKQHPDVCLTCHGGQPQKVTNGVYPNGGRINGFRYLPLDNNNLLFSSLNGSEATSLANQEAAIKVYNQEVLLTVPKSSENDGTGATRQAHLRTIITGWYSSGDNYSDDQSMSSPTQKTGWIPPGWREVGHGSGTGAGTAPAGAEKVYTNVLAPSCRSCHFNREISLDFGTYANFHQDSDLTQLALMPQCKHNGNPPATDLPDPGGRYMPLAHLTYEKFWQTQGGPIILPSGLTLDHEVDRLARDFGFSAGVAGYCATNP